VSKTIVTFTTDFGTEDHFVGTMKGVVLGINPEATVVDICNNVQPFDILEGALTIAHSYQYYPAGTVHVVVVDPGVGTTRRPIIVDSGKHIFIAPDNGVLSLVFGHQERLTVRHITAGHYFLQPVSSTFHGRDVFAAVAGHVSRGVDISKLGDPIEDYVRLPLPQPQVTDNGIVGAVLKADRFGNVITNITRPMVSRFLAHHTDGWLLRMGNVQVRNMQAAYAHGAPGEIFAIVSSMGYLEVATNRGNAAELIGARQGDEVELVGKPA
jgi:S-adenosyl-L-methionine hydrolase (adenosine-forming)